MVTIPKSYLYVMKEQNINNYRRYYAPHHFIFLPVMTGCIFVGVMKAIRVESQRLEWVLFAVLSFAILYLGIMLRQHYALGNQDRIVRLEFRLRYLELIGKSCSSIESRLTFSQIAALRFAGDDEFKVLVEKAINENISGQKIKESIRNWQADNMRV